MNILNIIGWQKISFIDYPGLISSVLFFKNCNLRCPWCHNPDIVFDRLDEIDFDTIEEFIEKRKNFLNGIVLSGGEPTIHKTLQTVVDLIRKKSNLKIKLDTNGLKPDVIKNIEPDYCALDIKTSIDNYNILGYKKDDSKTSLLKSIDIIKSMKEDAEIRITIVEPFINEKIIEEIGIILNGVSVVYLQLFDNTNKIIDKDSIVEQNVSIDTLIKYKQIFLKNGISCNIRNTERLINYK